MPSLLLALCRICGNSLATTLRLGKVSSRLPTTKARRTLEPTLKLRKGKIKAMISSPWEPCLRLPAAHPRKTVIAEATAAAVAVAADAVMAAGTAVATTGKVATAAQNRA